MNKNILIFGFCVWGLVTTSCKKSYTCECITDYTGGYKTIEKRTINKASKREAENICRDMDNTVTYPGGTINFKTSCTLK